MWFLTIAWKNLFQRKVRSTLTCLGMAVSVCTVATLIGVSQGFEQALSGLFEAHGVDIIVSRARSPQHIVGTLPERIAERLRELPGVRTVEPILMDVVSFERGELMAVCVVGRTPDSEIFGDQHLISGRAIRPTDRRAAVLGKALAQSLQMAVGDAIEIDGAPFTVIGIYESFNMFEDANAVVALNELQELMGRSGEATLFAVQAEQPLRNRAGIEALCRQMESLRNDQQRPLGISAMSTQNHVKTNVELKVMRGLTWSMSLIALLIGAIGMFNTMMISVFERTREIGTLQAVGWGRLRIAGLVLIESLLLAAAGVLLGICMSLALMALLSAQESLSTIVPPTAPPSILAVATLIGLATGAVGALVPAVHASRLLPTEALHYE